MHDRQPKYPGRIKLRDIETGEEKIYDMTMADEPTVEGDAPVTKNLLKQQTAALFGLGSDAVPDDMFNLLARCGDLYVWKRTANGETDYPVSPNEDAYEEENNEQQPTYTLGPVKSGSFFFTSGSWNDPIYIGSTPSVSDEGAVSLESIEYGNPQYNYTGNSGATKLQSEVAGKFFSLAVSYFDEFETGKVYFVPSDAQITWDGVGTSHTVLSKYQEVIGHPYVPATLIIESFGKLGAFGDKARIVTGSYVGTGKYGSSNQNTLNFDGQPCIVYICSGNYVSDYSNGLAVYGCGYMQRGLVQYDYPNTVTWDETSMKWYNSTAARQFNTSGTTYFYAALLQNKIGALT